VRLNRLLGRGCLCGCHRRPSLSTYYRETSQYERSFTTANNSVTRRVAKNQIVSGFGCFEAVRPAHFPSSLNSLERRKREVKSCILCLRKRTILYFIIYYISWLMICQLKSLPFYNIPNKQLIISADNCCHDPSSTHTNCGPSLSAHSSHIKRCNNSVPKRWACNRLLQGVLQEKCDIKRTVALTNDKFVLSQQPVRYVR
jgi:hypothetical protein